MFTKRSALRGEVADGCYFARGGKVSKTPPGTAFDERLRAAGAHRRLVPGPPFTGDALLILGGKLSAVLKQDRLVLLAPDLRSYVCKM